MFLFLFLFFSMLLITMLIFQIKRIISSKTSLLFFLNAKNLGRSDDVKRRKKEDGLSSHVLNKATNTLLY